METRQNCYFFYSSFLGLSGELAQPRAAEPRSAAWPLRAERTGAGPFATYTTGTAAGALQCRFASAQMAWESAGVLAGPVEVYPFDLKGWIGLGPLSPSLESCVITRQLCKVYSNRLIAFCFGDEFGNEAHL